jgi:hypothetical protein
MYMHNICACTCTFHLSPLYAELEAESTSFIVISFVHKQHRNWYGTP